MMKGDGRINLNKFSKKRSITNINIIDIINICYIFRESFRLMYYSIYEAFFNFSVNWFIFSFNEFKKCFSFEIFEGFLIVSL